MTNPVYANLEWCRSKMAIRSTSDFADVKGGYGDPSGEAEGYLAYARKNAPKEYQTALYRHCINAYVDLVSAGDERLAINRLQRQVRLMMGDNKRQHRHDIAIVRVALMQVFKPSVKYTDDFCAQMMHGRNVKTGRKGVSQQVYSATYKSYVEQVKDIIYDNLAVADGLVSDARRLDDFYE